MTGTPRSAGSRFRQSDAVPLRLCRAIWANPMPPTTVSRLWDLPPPHVPQHADEHRSERPVLLAVDQQLGEGAALRVAP
jgi:hypothetical protein